MVKMFHQHFVCHFENVFNELLQITIFSLEKKIVIATEFNLNLKMGKKVLRNTTFFELDVTNKYYLIGQTKTIQKIF